MFRNIAKSIRFALDVLPLAMHDLRLENGGSSSLVAGFGFRLCENDISLTDSDFPINQINSGNKSLVCCSLEAFRCCKYVLSCGPSFFAKPVMKISILRWIYIDDILKDYCLRVVKNSTCRCLFVMVHGALISMTFWKIRNLGVIDLDNLRLDKMRKGRISCVKVWWIISNTSQEVWIVSWISLQEGWIRLLHGNTFIIATPFTCLRSTPEKHTF